MDIRKDGENTHGPIYAIYAHGEHIGSVEKWHGLFITKGSCGTKLGMYPHERRQDAAQEVLDAYLESFEY